MSGPKEGAGVLVPLAPGFEEIEAVTIIDVLRRAGVRVVTAGLEAGPVVGSHGIAIQPDTTVDAADAADFRMIALPGGMPGAEHLRRDPHVQALLRALKERSGWTAAICAAPIAFGPGKVAEGRAVTSYPGFGDQIGAGSYREDRVVVDGRVVTSRGPGTALEFALTLVEVLAGKAAAQKLESAMLVRRSEAAHVVSGSR